MERRCLARNGPSAQTFRNALGDGIGIKSSQFSLGEGLAITCALALAPPSLCLISQHSYFELIARPLQFSFSFSCLIQFAFFFLSTPVHFPWSNQRVPQATQWIRRFTPGKKITFPLNPRWYSILRDGPEYDFNDPMLKDVLDGESFQDVDVIVPRRLIIARMTCRKCRHSNQSAWDVSLFFCVDPSQPTLPTATPAIHISVWVFGFKEITIP